MKDSMDLTNFDLFSPEHLVNPYPAYKGFLEAGLYKNKSRFPSWVVSRFDDVATILKSPNTSTTKKAFISPILQTEDGKLVVGRSFANMFNFVDSPDHGRLRQPFNRLFALNSSNETSQIAIEACNEILNEIDSQSEIDMLGPARKFSLSVTARLLGFERSQEELLVELTHVMNSILAKLPNGQPLPQESAKCTALLNTIYEIIDSKIQSVAGVSSEQFSQQEWRSTLIQFVLAGTESASNLITNTLFHIYSKPEIQNKILADINYIDKVIEETLRFESPIQMTSRTATSPITLGDNTIQTGEHITLLLAAANRDPHCFSEPDVFNPDRNDCKHMAFGLGTHFCIGAKLGTLEASLLIKGIFSRFPESEMKQMKHEWQPSPLFRGLKTLIILPHSQKLSI
jgi:pimeloyl-[acyl-carrier protein] synthase